MAYLGHKPAVGENNSFRILDDISSFVLTFDGSSASVVGLSDETITITENNHRFITGQRVTYSNGGGGNITGLTNGQAYFVINHSKTQIKLASSASNALAGTAINLTGLGTGSSHTLTLAFDGVNTKFDPTFGNGMHDTLIKRAAQLVISINGVIQQPHDTATPTTGFGVDSLGHIIFSTAPASTDIFWGHILATNTVTFDSSDNDVDTFTGDGSTTSFTLSKIPPDNRNILVTIDGVVQYPSDAANTRSYNVSENVMTFVAAPGLGTVIQVRHIGYAGIGAGGGGGVTGFYGRTGNVSLVSTDNIVANNATFSGNVSIAQTLTYEDVTDIDSVGLITARSGIKDQTLTAGRVIYVDSDKTLTDSANLTFDGNDVGIARSIFHLGDKNTTIGFPDNDKILLRTGGTDRVSISGAGLSITAGNPALRLHGTSSSFGDTAKIIASRNNDGSLITGSIVFDPVNAAGADIIFNTRDSNIVGERVRIKNDGKVGIGTDNPSALLHVAKYTYDDPDNENFFRIKLQDQGGIMNDVGIGQIASGSLSFNNTASGRFSFHNGTNGEIFRIASSNSNGGGVGISTAGGNIGPDGNALLIRAKSSVGTNKGHIMLTGDSATTDEGPQIVFSESGSGSNWVGGAIGFRRTGGNSVGDLVFGVRTVSGDASTTPTEVIRITSAKKVGINDDNPERTLDVVGSNAMIQIEGSGGSGRQYSLCSTDNTTGAAVGSAGQFVIYDDTAGDNRLNITSAGHIGINESGPIHQLSIGINTSTAYTTTKNISNTTNNDFIGLNLTNKNTGSTPEIGIMLQAGTSGAGQFTINCLRTGGGTADFLVRTRDGGGSSSKEVLRITSGGSVLINTTVDTEASSDGNELIIGSTSNTHAGLSIVGSTSGGIGNIFFSDGASYKNQGIIQYRHADDSMRFTVGQYEALRLTDDGELRINFTKGTNNVPAKLRLHCGDASIAASQVIGEIRFAGRDAGGTDVSRTGALIQATAAGTWDTLQTNGYAATHLDFFTQNNSGTDTVAAGYRLRIDRDGVARFINSTGELKIASSTNNDSGKIIFQENTTGAWSLEAQRANGYFRILDEYNGNQGSPQERFRITPAGQVSISDDGTTDGLLTIKGNTDATTTPSIRLLDGSDTREVSISNQSGDLIMSTHGTDNAAHGTMKIYDSGIIALSTDAGAGNAERLRIDSHGAVRHMGTSAYWQITVIHNGSGSGNWYSGSAPQRIRPNYIDNRTGYAEFLIEFNPSTSYSGWQEPTFVICGGSGGLKTGGTIELNMNRRTNSPNNATFRSYHGQFSWQIYNDGDGDVTGGQREINRNVEHRSSYWIDPSTQSIDYIHSLDSRYDTNAEPLINQRSFIKIKMNNSQYTSYAIQGHPFICRFVTYRQGDDNWFAYMQYN